MSRRLVKIAKELNVGTSTIVDYLADKGFVIDNKPTAKVNDEMYDVLLVKFSNSMTEKKKADEMVIGNRTNKEEAAPAISTRPTSTEPTKSESRVSVPKLEDTMAAEKAAVEKKAKEEAEKIAAEKAAAEKLRLQEEQRKKEEAEKAKPKAELKGLKIQGKIDLNKPKAEKPKAEQPKPKPEVKKEVAKPTPTPVTPKPVETKAPPKGEPAPKDVKTPPAKPVLKTATAKEDILRAKTPELKGLKIQGKIDLSKLTPKKKDDKKKTQSAGGGSRRSPRPRTKIKADVYMRGQQRRGPSGGNRKPKKDEVKEVSKKEIEDKIKATMARISGGGKNRRQKIRRVNREEKRERQEIIDQATQTDVIQLTEFISVSELANLMGVSVSQVITTCMNLGVIVSINQRLDAEIIELLAEEFNKEIKFIGAEEELEEEEEIVDDPADLEGRAPIVTVMGHVDHGKTSLLDYIRSANVASGEAGGITQHIGAYEVSVKGKKITFLDTPGHEAFTAMRARGAKVTDVVVIIVAADDNVMPQTKEAISHAQAAGVPMVFAINKIDKDGSDPERIKQELAGMNILVEEWGGKFQSQDISAKTGLGIDSLLEKIALEAEVLDLKANPKREALGTVVEASLDKGRGYVIKLLVQNGTLKIGDAVTAGAYSGKVKAMFNENGKRVKIAGPSAPVLVLGLSGAPQAGEKFKVYETEQEARQVAVKRSQISREQTVRASKRISLDEIGRRLALGTFKELNLIVKGDVDGSIEALSDSLIKLSVESIQVNVIHKAVGQISESDVLLASASDAIVVGFQVRPTMGARNLAEKEGVQIKMYSIIYEVIDEIKMAMEGMLEPKEEEKIVAQVEIRETFKISKVGTIAGSYVLEGAITRNTKIRVIREGIVVYPTKEGVIGELSSLKRFKDDAKEVKKGMECGLSVKNYNDIKIGDIIEGYDIVSIKQTLK